MLRTFHANGKLLLTGEYVVLWGAKALAFPTRFGQSLTVKSQPGALMQWKSLDHLGQVWFEASFDPSYRLRAASDKEQGHYLETLLQTAHRLGNATHEEGLRVETRLNFPNDWGLGSSSTLIHLVAQWFGCNAMALFNATTTGSGYDIACASARKPLIYHLSSKGPQWYTVSLPAVFKEVLFVHLNHKQRSAPEVHRFQQKAVVNKAETARHISQLTRQFLEAPDTGTLARAIEQHEQFLHTVLDRPMVKQNFPDFPGSLKSLGAWGGDFIMALGDDSANYFRDKGYTTQFTLQEIIYR